MLLLVGTAVLLWKVVIQLRSYVPIENQVMRQIEEKECLENRDVLPCKDSALLKVVDEVRAVLPLLFPLSVRETEHAKYLTGKRLLDA